MSFLYFFNVWALIALFIAGALSFLLYRKSACPHKLISMADFTSILIFAVSLGALMYVFSALNDLSLIGNSLAIIILANFYAALCNIICRLVSRRCPTNA